MDDEVNLYGPLPFTVRVIVKGYDKIGGPVGCGKRGTAHQDLLSSRTHGEEDGPPHGSRRTEKCSVAPLEDREPRVQSPNSK